MWHSWVASVLEVSNTFLWLYLKRKQSIYKITPHVSTVTFPAQSKFPLCNGLPNRIWFMWCPLPRSFLTSTLPTLVLLLTSFAAVLLPLPLPSTWSAVFLSLRCHPSRLPCTSNPPPLHHLSLSLTLSSSPLPSLVWLSISTESIFLTLIYYTNKLYIIY